MKITNIANKNGSALVIALMMSLIIVFLISVGGILITTSRRETLLYQNVLTQADNIARAGLMDATSWFKRQENQPVRSGNPPTIYPYADGAFDPKYNSNPLLSDTIDESIGIVREYQLSEDGKTWARYEVYRQQDPVSNPYNPDAVHDITEQRIDGRSNGEGLVWYIQSTGYVFRRSDPETAFDQLPNKIIAKVKASTELRVVTLKLPAQAAVMSYNSEASNLEKILIRNNGWVVSEGNIPAIAWHVGTKKPKIHKDAVVTDPKFGNCDDPTIESIFGLPKSELQLVADIVVTNTSYLPQQLPDMIFTYIKGDAIFTNEKPLKGSGVLFVDGNLHIQQGSNSIFNGFVYVTGEAMVDEASLISGALVAYDRFELSNSESVNVAKVEYNSIVLNNVRNIACGYRENRSTLHVFIGIAGLE
jgi:hypothetical protein